MISLAWGGYTNGSVPDSALSPIDGQGHKLEHAAAAQYLAMQAAMLRDLGRTISVAPGSDSANRTLAQQQADYALYQHGGNVAAYPGTSNHGWARAVDITGYEGPSRWISPTTGRAYYVDLQVWNWLQAHAAEYGFHWATGDASGEGWHWESYNTPSATAVAAVSSTPISNTTTHTSTLLEDEMPYILSSDAGQTFITDGHPIPFNSPADVQITSGSGVPTVAVSRAMHNAILTELGKKASDLPIIVDVTGDATIYLLTGDRLVPLAVSTDVQTIQNAGATRITIDPRDRDQLLKSV